MKTHSLATQLMLALEGGLFYYFSIIVGSRCTQPLEMSVNTQTGDVLNDENDEPSAKVSYNYGELRREENFLQNVYARVSLM